MVIWKNGTQLLKDGKIIWNDKLEVVFKELEWMVSDKTLLNYRYLTIQFTVHTDVSDKQLGAVISDNNKHIVLFSIKSSKL